MNYQSGQPIYAGNEVCGEIISVTDEAVVARIASRRNWQFNKAKTRPDNWEQGVFAIPGILQDYLLQDGFDLVRIVKVGRP